MRIAHVITRLIVGGAQENTVSSVLGLNKKKDITIRLYSGPTNGPEALLNQILKASQIYCILSPD